jgi:hypothetical protein
VSEIRTVCCVCGTVTREGALDAEGLVSHGLCSSCVDVVVHVARNPQGFVRDAKILLEHEHESEAAFAEAGTALARDYGLGAEVWDLLPAYGEPRIHARA